MQELQTNQVYQFGKIIPFFFCFFLAGGGRRRRGGGGATSVDLGAETVSKPLFSSGSDRWIGFSEKELKNYEGIRPAPDTLVAIKKHLPSCFS